MDSAPSRRRRTVDEVALQCTGPSWRGSGGRSARKFPRPRVGDRRLESRRERLEGRRRPGPLAARRPTRTAGCLLRSVARSRNSSARSRSRSSVCASAPGRVALTPHVRQSAGIDSRWPNLASTAAADFAPQPGRPGIAVGRVADQREVVGNRCRRARRISRSRRPRRDRARPAIHLHDARAAHALRQILVRRADDHALHARDRAPPPPLPRPAHRRPRTRPSARSRCRARSALLRAAGTARRGPGRCRRRSCSPATSVAERLDDVIGRDAEVARAAC